jgi:mRNA interferase HigB
MTRLSRSTSPISDSIPNVTAGTQAEGFGSVSGQLKPGLGSSFRATKPFFGKGRIELIDHTQCFLGGEQLKACLSIEFGERHRGPFLDELFEAQPPLFSKALKTLMLVVWEADCHCCQHRKLAMSLVGTVYHSGRSRILHILIVWFLLIGLEVSQNGNILLAHGPSPCESMRIISRKRLNGLATRYPEAKVELDAWFHEAEAVIWADPAQLKAQYGNASILKGSRVVFNICGNKYRLVVKINYPYSVVYVRFAGTHLEYDRINVQEI